MKLADLKKGKAVGFYVTLGLILASLITAIVYIACFFGTDEMNYVSFAILLLGAIASGALQEIHHRQLCRRLFDLPRTPLLHLRSLLLCLCRLSRYRSRSLLRPVHHHDNLLPSLFRCWCRQCVLAASERRRNPCRK